MNVKILTLSASILALMSLKAASSALPVLNPHKISFGLLQVDYDYLGKDQFYAGLGANMHTLMKYKDKVHNLNNYSTNIEGRMGYNFSIPNEHTCTAYIGFGYSHFSVDKTDFLKDWGYVTAGVKPITRLGTTFSLGLHAKGYYTLAQNSTLVVLNDDKLSAYYGEEEVIETSHGEKRFGYELGLPLIWNLGDAKAWEIQLEPYYLKMPDTARTNLIGSRLTFGYRF